MRARIADEDRLDQADACAESRAPPSELWSSGQTTAVLSGGKLGGERDERREMIDVSTISAGRSRASVIWVTVGASTSAVPSQTIWPSASSMLGVEHSDRLFPLLAADDRDLELVADMNATQEAQVLRAVERARAGQA